MSARLLKTILHASIWSFGWLGGAATALACGAEALRLYVGEVQQLLPTAEARGRALLRCQNEADEAAQWLAFQLALTSRGTESMAIDPLPFAVAQHVPGRAGAIARAKAGRYEELLRSVESATPGYATAADVQLVLARALVRKGRYGRGREAYLDYLRLRPADDAAQAEYLYSFIWAGDAETARSKLRETRGWRMGPELASAVQRGWTLVANRNPPAPSEGSGGVSAPREPVSTPGAPEERVALELASSSIGDVYRRNTLRARYDGPVEVAVAGHGVAVRSVETYDQRVTELGIGGRLRVTPELELGAVAGYVVADDAAFRGATHMTVGAPATLHGEVGFEREPLLLSMPLTEDEQLLMRDSAHLLLGYGRYAELRSRLARDDDRSAFERHEFLLRLPLLKGEDGVGSLEGRIPASLENRPRPSPSYEADARTVAFGLGLEATQNIREDWQARAIVDYVTASATRRDVSESIERYAVVAARFHVSWRAAAAVELSVGGIYHHADGREREEALALPTGLEIGAAYVR